MGSKLGNFIIRVLIFQFVFLFIFSKIKNPPKSIKDFSKRLKFIAKNNQMSKEQIELLETKSPQIFIILFSLYSFFGVLSIFNFNFCKRVTGIITFLMAVIYCNPVSTIKKNFEKYMYEPQKWKLYIPSMEFILIAILGLIMILSSFYSKNDDTGADDVKEDVKGNVKDKEKEIKKEEKTQKEKVN